MHDITAENAAAYLVASGHVGDRSVVRVRELAGGVSNAVFYVEHAPSTDAPPDAFVLKQARPQLRVAQPWFCNVERSWRELEVLRVCQQLLADQISAADTQKAKHPLRDDELVAITPRVLWDDRDNYAFAMTAAPADHRVWKQALLAPPGDAASLGIQKSIAKACGNLLSTLHARSWDRAEVARRLTDRAIFDALRLDPYYRTVAMVHPDLRPTLERLIASVGDHAQALVHADFSPKNLLVFGDADSLDVTSGNSKGTTTPRGLMMVDFETGHFGDPAFDMGFFLTHLALKAFYHAPLHESLLRIADVFWQVYADRMSAAIGSDQFALLSRRGMAHLAACMLARIDGKSPVEYLSDAATPERPLLAERRDLVRGVSRIMLAAPPADWPEASAAIDEALVAFD